MKPVQEPVSDAWMFGSITLLNDTGFNISSLFAPPRARETNSSRGPQPRLGYEERKKLWDGGKSHQLSYEGFRDKTVLALSELRHESHMAWRTV